MLGLNLIHFDKGSTKYVSYGSFFLRQTQINRNYSIIYSFLFLRVNKCMKGRYNTVYQASENASLLCVTVLYLEYLESLIYDHCNVYIYIYIWNILYTSSEYYVSFINPDS